jgi:heat shock protein HslJ
LLASAALLTACASSPTAENPKAKAGSPTEKYWKLVEVNGQSVPTLKREPHLILKAEGQRVNGFGGCNGFGGTYEIDEAQSRIRFEGIVGTLMACQDGMEVEKSFHEALRQADGYAQDGDRLTLNQGTAPLARFQAVYMR